MITTSLFLVLVVMASETQSPCPASTEVTTRKEKLGKVRVTRYMCKASSGKFVGPWVVVYKNGKYAQTGSYNKAGKLDGELVYFSEAGARLARTNFVDGVETGERAAYFPNAELQSVGPVMRGKPDGRWSFFFENGHKESEGVMKAGVTNGHWTYWDDEGRVLRNGGWQAGQKAGIWFERKKGDANFRKLQYESGQAIVLSSGPSDGVVDARCSQVSTGWWVLKVSDLGRVVAGWPQGLGQSQVNAVMRGGTIFGYKVSNIRPGSMVDSCGFKSGDVIRSINDIQTTSLEAFRVASERVRAQGTAVFHLERDHRIVLVRIEKR